jgi:hypothetical protein
MKLYQYVMQNNLVQFPLHIRADDLPSVEYEDGATIEIEWSR